MNDRIFIKDLHEHIDADVRIAGWVEVRRDHGKLIFLDIRDRSGVVQAVVGPKAEAAKETAETVRSEWVVAIRGHVKQRPEKMVNPDQKMGDVELEIAELEVLSEAHELPFDKDAADVNIDTYLDNLPLTLRTQRGRDIFTVQAALLQEFRSAMIADDFSEYVNPILVGGDGEGGAAAFGVEYYNDRRALLATSPQLYKQTMVGVFERAFTTTKVFRAEKHATSRHLSEALQMDFELGFINDHEDVMDVLEHSTRRMVNNVAAAHSDILARFEVDAPLADNPFPRLTLREAQKIIEDEFGDQCVGEPDLEPDHERKICEWAKREHGSDFVFITHFPVEKRPFYTFVDEADPAYTKSFDLLFRGLEINSGSQRIHDYNELVERIKAKGLDPNVFAFYLQAFKYGLPPHGGCSTGLERLTARFLGLANIKEATLFPRDINRIDTLLSQSE